MIQSDTALLFRQNAHSFAVVAKSQGDQLEECLASTSHNGDAWAVAALRLGLLLVQHLDGCFPPLLRHPPRPPCVRNDGVELSWKHLVPVKKKLRKFRREPVRPCSFPAGQPLNCLPDLKHEGYVFERSTRSPKLNRVIISPVKGR